MMGAQNNLCKGAIVNKVRRTKNINVNKSEGWEDVCFQLGRNLECYKKSDLNKFEHELVRMTHLERGRGSGWF